MQISRTAITSLQERVEALRGIVETLERNREQIQTLSGTYQCQDETRMSSPQISKRFGVPEPAPGDTMAQFSAVQHSEIDFALNQIEGSLFNEIRSTRFYVKKLPTAKRLDIPEPRPLRRRCIVTPSEYVYLHTDIEHGELINSPGKTPDGDRIPGKFPTQGRIAFREPLEDAEQRQLGTIIDPLRLYNYTTPFEQLFTMLADGLEQEPPTNNEIDAETAHRAWQVTREGLRVVRITYEGGREDTSVEFQMLADPGGDETIVSTFQFSNRCGGLPISASVRNPEGVAIDMVSWNYWDVDGVFLPAHVARTQTQDGLNIDFQRILDLQEVELNPPVAADQFTLTGLGLKDGERFVDKVLGKTFVFSDGQLVGAAEFHHAPSGFPTLLVVNILAILAVAAAFYHLGRSRSEPTDPAGPAVK